MGKPRLVLAKIRLCMSGDMTVTPRLRYLAQGCPPLLNKHIPLIR